MEKDEKNYRIEIINGREVRVATAAEVKSLTERLIKENAESLAILKNR